MDDLACDPDIGPDLVILLTQKVKTTREALNASLKENADLREQIAELKAEREGHMQNQGLTDERLMNVTCRIGQCKSRDEVESLRIQLAEVTRKLQASEQRVNDSLHEVAEMKQKYQRANEPSWQIQERNKNPVYNDQGPRSEIDHNHDTAREVRHTNAAPHDTLPVSSIQQWSLRPCMPPKMSPASLPQHLRNLLCKGGVLFWPAERCSVNPISGSAITYACQQRYKSWAPDEKQSWTTSNELNGFKGRRRELFYRAIKGEVSYAGTFEASSTVRPLDITEYRNLPENMRNYLLESCIVPAPSGLMDVRKASQEDKAVIADRYWRGEAKVMYLEWKRVEFNTALFEGILALRAQIAKNDSDGTQAHASGSKRRHNQEPEIVARKKSRPHTTY